MEISQHRLRLILNSAVVIPDKGRCEIQLSVNSDFVCYSSSETLYRTRYVRRGGTVGKVVCLRPERSGFEPRPRRHVGTLQQVLHSQLLAALRFENSNTVSAL